NHLAAELPADDGASGSGGSGTSSTSSTSETSEAPIEEAAAAPPPAVEARPGKPLFGRRATPDVTVESRMQVWLPAQPPYVRRAAAPYRTYSLEVSGGVEGLFTLHRLALETDGSTWFLSSGAAVTPSIGGAGAGAAAALAMVGLPFLR